MKLLAFVLIASLLQDLPLKPTSEFEVTLDFKFKQRPFDNSAVYVNETQREHERRNSTALLPYLTLNIKLLSLPQGETKMRITANKERNSSTKKISEGATLPLVIGFTDDAKDRVAASEYVLTFLKPDKSETNKVVISIEDDGTFRVNGEKRGKF